MTGFRLVELAAERMSAISAERCGTHNFKVAEYQMKRDRLRRWFPWLKPLSADEAAAKLERDCRQNYDVPPWEMHEVQFKGCIRLMGIGHLAAEGDIFLSTADASFLGYPPAATPDQRPEFAYDGY